MNPMVEAYLAAKEQEKQEKDSAEDQKRQKEINSYRKKVLRKAGLIEKKMVEVDKTEYYNLDGTSEIKKDENGNKHYYMEKKTPIEVTDEEFAEIEKTFSREELEAMQDLPTEEKIDRRIEGEAPGTTVFFNTLGVIFIVVGLIISIVVANVEVVKEVGYRTVVKNEFSFPTFMTSFIIYLVFGCFCFCAGSLFHELRRIVNLLRNKK